MVWGIQSSGQQGETEENTSEIGLYGKGFYFTENKEVAESYIDKGTNVGLLGTHYDTLFNIQDRENRVKINSIAKDLIKENEKKLDNYLKAIEWAKGKSGYLGIALQDKFGVYYNMPRMRTTLKKRIKALKEIPNMGDAELNQYISKARFRNSSYVPHDYRLYDRVKEAIPTLEPQLYSVYLNIRNPLNMDSKIPTDLKKQILNDKNIKQMMESRKNTMASSARIKGMVIDEKAYKKALRTIRNAKSYNLFYGGLRQLTATSVGIFGDRTDHKDSSDYLMTKFIEYGKHDGITHIGGHATNAEIKHRVWIALNPNQIKAVENRGTFNNKTNNMFKSKLSLPTYIPIRKAS